MARSIQIFAAAALAWLLSASAVIADDASKSSGIKDKDAPSSAPVSREDRARFYALPGEDPPQPFVPLRPRTVEERRHVDATIDYGVAEALEKRHQWAEAIALLEQALKIEPDSVTILRRLSGLCFSLGRTETGVKYSRQVLEADPGDTSTITRLVGYFKNRNDPAGAESLLKEVLANPKLDKHTPGRLVAEYELGKLYDTRLKQVDRAADAFARVMDALDDKSVSRLSPDDQSRVLGGDEAAAYQEFGTVFDKAKRYELAVKAYERGLVYDPDDPTLPLLLAESLLKLNRGEQALARVEAFLKRQPQGVEGYDLLGKILKVLNREAEITPKLEAASAVDSKNVALQYVLADRYRETGQVERADAMYKSLLAAQPTTQGFGALASSLFKRRKAEELLKVIQQAVARPGGFEVVRDQLDGIVKDSTMADEVLDAGGKLYSAEPPKLDRYGLLVLNYVATNANKLDRFLPVQKLVLRRNPSPIAYKEMIALLAQLKKFDDAAATIEEMLAKYPAERNARNLAELSDDYRRAEQYEKAITAAREALKLDPTEFSPLIPLTLALSQTGKTDEAVELLKASMAKDPANPAPAMILGSVLTQAGRNEDALALFKGMLEKFPNNEEVTRAARSNLSIIYVNMGDYTKGEAELEALLERNPDDPGVNNDLGYLWADQGKNLEKAEAMIRRAVQEDDDNSAYLDSLGWVLFKRGKIKEAVVPLEKAAKMSSDSVATDSTIFEHLGDVYFQLKETAKARQAWTSAEKAALKSNPPDKRLPEVRKKLESLRKLESLPKESSGDTP